MDIFAVEIITAGNTAGNSADYLIVYGARKGCNFINGNKSISVPAENGYNIALFRFRNCGNVQHGLVHAYAANNGGVFSADYHSSLVGKKTVISVRIADGGGSYFHIAWRGKAAAVTYAAAFFKIFCHTYNGAKFHRRAKLYAAGNFLVGGGIKSVKDNSRTHHIKMHLRIAENSGTVAAMADADINAFRFKGVAYAAETVKLELCIFNAVRVRFVRGSKMSHTWQVP